MIYSAYDVLLIIPKEVHNEVNRIRKQKVIENHVLKYPSDIPRKML